MLVFVYLNANKARNLKILVEYNFTIDHQSANHVDALNRAPVEEREKDIFSELLSERGVYNTIMSEDQLRIIQESNKNIEETTRRSECYWKK